MMLGMTTCVTTKEECLEGGRHPTVHIQDHQGLQETMTTIPEILSKKKKETTTETGMEKRMTGATGTTTTGEMVHLSLRRDRCAGRLDHVREFGGAEDLRRQHRASLPTPTTETRRISGDGATEWRSGRAGCAPSSP